MSRESVVKCLSRAHSAGSPVVVPPAADAPLLDRASPWSGLFCPQRPSLPDLFCPLVPHDMDISVPEFLVELPCYPPRLVTWRARRLKYWTRFAESPRCPSRNRGIPFGHVVRDSNCRVTLACRPHIAHSLSSIRRDRWMWVFIFEVLNPLRWEVLFEKTPCRGSAIA